MPLPDLAVLAEGDLPTGQHWILRGGGTSTDFYTFLETVHPDGRRDEGGMGGPPLCPGSLLNIYSGGSERGLRRIVVRADPRVARVRVHLASGEPLELPPLATLPDVGVSFFAILLPQTAGLVSVTAIGAQGQELEPQDLARHEACWQRFLFSRARPAVCAAYGRVRGLPQSLLSECRPGDMSWHAMTGGSGGRTDGAAMALFRRHVDAEATALGWTRTVDIEQQQWVSKRSEWHPSGETRNVQRHQESYWETVTDWQPGSPDADGTPGPQQPVTRQELRTRTFYTYEALEWRVDRTLTASGADRNDVRWPEYTLAPGERIRGKAETYSVTFTGPARQYETTLGETQWRTLTLGTTYRLSLGLLGGVREVTPA